MIVAARTAGSRDDASGITLFLVPSDAPGVTRTRSWMVDSRNAALIRLDGVELGEDAVLGQLDGGGEILDRVLDRARAGLAAQMFCEIELARSAVIAALVALDASDSVAASALASLAKAKAGEAFFLVGNEAVQMDGGIGMTDEHEIGFFLKRARVAQASFGDTAFQRRRYADLGGY